MKGRSNRTRLAMVADGIRMIDRHEDKTETCPGCGASIEISQNWTAGGINDYGGWVLQCVKCSHIFRLRLGRDIQDSSVRKGAMVLAVYCDSMDDESIVLKRFGLA